ncbi:MAG: hypothetical protein QF797_07075 [Alphaproteobacteria bacterium]|jgi:hypothetical protein|nr:hypothetical protein [Rhodospirillaceae bacterium]MDP6404951.1 hypothetical protein [Alphaproteobacteria bacterium]MDP6621147.1 hypothetical protein [Alphaproteobacteria bacterium]
MADHSTDRALAGSLGSLGKASSGVAFELGYHESPLRAFAAVLDADGEASLREFPNIADAVAWARKQLLAAPGLRVGVNLCELPPGDEPRRRRGIAFAEQLRDQAEAGGLCVSAVSFERLTSRLTAGDLRQNEDPPAPFATTLQWTLLLGYFVVWMGLASWKAIEIAVHGSFQCWPSWLCG